MIQRNADAASVRVYRMRAIVSIPLILILLSIGCAPIGRTDNFRFVFMTDIHIQPELRATEGFEAAIAHVNRLKPKPAFVITGGDLIMDALGQSYSRADSLYALYIETCRHFEMPVHNGIGNHEIFGLYSESGINPDHPEYGKQMYRNRVGEGNTYHSFDHGNWHFIVLDGIGMTEERRYIGEIDEAQIEWLKKDLERTGPERPVALCIHIPFFSAAIQFRNGPTAANSSGGVIQNGKEVWDICDDYNIKLVLQGHLHIVEELAWKRFRFITAGAVSGAWWRGPLEEFEEGFVVVDVKGDNFTWAYEDYGWEAESRD